MTRRHFSLLEIVTAVALLGVIATLTGTLLFAMQQGWNKLQENADQLETLMKLERVADQLFCNAVPFHWPDEKRQNRQIFLGEPERVRLACLARINRPEEVGLRFAELFLRDSELIARYREYPLLGDNEEKPHEEILASKIQSLAFLYGWSTGDEVQWSDTFDAVQAENIPAAIRMIIVWDDGARTDFLRRTAGNSSISTYGKYDANKNRQQ